MIDNEFYKHLGDKWYTAEGDAVALLRLEKNATNPWAIARIRERHGDHAEILDVGCGGGFLSFDLLKQGWRVTALDVDEGVLRVGRERDPWGDIRWVEGRAEALPFADAAFDVVCMMDVLEHIFAPRDALAEATRVLRPGGTLLFHTFNQTWMAWLFAAKGLDWFIKDSQEHIHDWALFIDPRRLAGWLNELGCEVERLEGLHPRILSRAFLKLLFTRRVPKDFEFVIGGRLDVGYLGCAEKRARSKREPQTPPET